MPVGVMVTLRGRRMYEFLDRFVHNALPRVRDFRGISPKGFDGVGNYNVGLSDVSVFTEVDADKLKYPLGINIAMVTTAKTDAEARELLTMLEVPFDEDKAIYNCGKGTVSYIKKNYSDTKLSYIDDFEYKIKN